MCFIRYRSFTINPDDFEICQLCERTIHSTKMEVHHVVPKSLGGKHDKTFRFCASCHDYLHYIISIEDISKYNTIEKIMNIPEIKVYLEWIKTKKDNVIYKLKSILKAITGQK